VENVIPDESECSNRLGRFRDDAGLNVLLDPVFAFSDAFRLLVLDAGLVPFPTAGDPNDRLRPGKKLLSAEWTDVADLETNMGDGEGGEGTAGDAVRGVGGVGLFLLRGRRPVLTLSEG